MEGIINMRVNIYTEELNPTTQPRAEIVVAEYVSSRTGQPMKNYGLRIYLQSAPELHFIPGRDDDRSAVTFWCGTKENNVFKFLNEIGKVAYASTLDIWRDKTAELTTDIEQTLSENAQRAREE